jgi:hypothetical protein
MDRTIEDNKLGKEDWAMVFVDTIDDYYSEIARVPTEEDSSPDSPFIGKSPEECFQLLVKLREDTESEIMPDFFIIMDERSTTDDTVLLVYIYLKEDYETWGVKTLRASFEASGLALMMYHVGRSSVEEDAERAQFEKDGVYRGRFSRPA